jgi:transcriptional regulator GlxA family with amidase domain
MHKVAVLALHGVVPLDLGIACDAFGRVRSSNGRMAYRVLVCGEARRVRSGVFDIHPPCALEKIASADTLIIPGIDDANRSIPTPVLTTIRRAWDRGVRIASICSGAFVLAQTGLLDGRRATTHWIGAAEFARRFPKVRLDPNVLFVDEGRIVTSAGATAGLDMCLHLVRRDHGQAVAAEAARLAVAPLDRDGGQAQFIHRQPPGTRASLGTLLEWMSANLERTLDIDTLATQMCMSPRTLSRRFREQTGTTPIQWLLGARVRRAQELLESSSASIEEIAAAAGFESSVTFRIRFQKVIGLPPATYRRRFNAPGTRTMAAGAR